MKLSVGEVWNAITAACVLVLTVVVVSRARGSGSDTAPAGMGRVAAIDSALWGELVQSRLAFGKGGDIEIVQFSDFECPACRGFSDRVIQRLKSDSASDVLANTPGGGAIVLGVADDGARIGTALDAEWLRHRIFQLTNRQLTISARDHNS